MQHQTSSKRFGRPRHLPVDVCGFSPTGFSMFLSQGTEVGGAHAGLGPVAGDRTPGGIAIGKDAGATRPGAAPGKRSKNSSEKMT